MRGRRVCGKRLTTTIDLSADGSRDCSQSGHAHPWPVENLTRGRVKRGTAGSADGERSGGESEHCGVLEPTIRGEEAVGRVDARGDSHGDGRDGARGGSRQAKGQGNTRTGFTEPGQHSTRRGRAEAHRMHALAGAFDAAATEPAKEFLGPMGDEHAAQGDAEKGLCCRG